jgi:hypothetical protein
MRWRAAVELKFSSRYARFKKGSDPNGIIPADAGLYEVAFGSDDCADAQGSRTEVRIGFAIAARP